MAITKVAISFQSSAAAAVGTSITAAALDLTLAYGALVEAVIANQASAPTVGCDFVIQVSGDNFVADTSEFFRATAGVTASIPYKWAVSLPSTIMYARTMFSGNTGNSVNVVAIGSKVTAV